MKQCSFSKIFCLAESLNYIIHFYITKIGLSSSVFTIKILAVEMIGYY